jgi:glycosyltransferase involved in cell wall biosynthesis
MGKDKHFTAGILELINMINCRKYKAIILYLLGENDRPRESLLILLSEMAGRGYLCLVCYPSDFGENKSLGENLISVGAGLDLIPVMRNLAALVLTTQNIEPAWHEILYHKYLWLHVEKHLLAATEDVFDQANLISFFSSHLSWMESFKNDDRCFPLQSCNEQESNANRLEARIKSRPAGWQIYANVALQGKVAVMTATFLDYGGTFFYSGGAERYLLDLAEVCAEMGHEMVIFQYGDSPWMHRFKNIDIISLSRCGQKAEGWMLRCAKAFNRIFYEMVQGQAVLCIYSAFFEAWPLAASPNIGISHGVSWDNPYSAYENALAFWLMNERYIAGAKACEELVSVDTNTANWLQTVDFEMGQKTILITNYVDLSAFKPREGYTEKRDKTVILYPRQLYAARGLYLVLEIMDEILVKYPEVEFHFVGRGGAQDIEQVIDKKKDWGERVKYYPLTMEEMPRAYQAADISLIPSVHSEGTSLSCLEAMASGNAVIASRIGGLPDLLLDNYNGLLIDPRPEALREAIETLLEDQQRMIDFKKRNIEVAKAFSRRTWRKRWKALLTGKIKPAAAVKSKPGRTIEIELKGRLVDYCKLGGLVTALLNNNYLVYIRASEVPDPRLSFARIQWLAPDTPLFSTSDARIEWQEDSK